MKHAPRFQRDLLAPAVALAAPAAQAVTFNWNADPLYFQSSAAVRNTGLSNATNDHQMFCNGRAAPSFINTGLIVKSSAGRHAGHQLLCALQPGGG